MTTSGYRRGNGQQAITCMRQTPVDVLTAAEILEKSRNPPDPAAPIGFWHALLGNPLGSL